MLANLANVYYATPGSATSAMRSAIDVLNEDLLEQNLQLAHQGKQIIGLLTMTVLRGNRLYLAQSGPLQAFLMQSGNVRHMFDPEDAGRGLGLSKIAQIRFYQSEISAGNRIMITPLPPQSWDIHSMRTHGSLPIGSFYQRLMALSGMELDAVLVEFKPGKGVVEAINPEDLPKPDETPDDAQVDIPQAEKELIIEEIVSAPPVEEEPELVEPISETISTAPLESPEEIRVPKPEKSVKERKPIGQVVLPVFRSIGRAIGNTYKSIAGTTNTAARRILPDESIFNISSSLMVLIAVAVPLVIIAIASVVYSQRGRIVLYEEYYSKANSAALQAIELNNPDDLRAGWQAVVDYIETAETYQETKDSSSLRNYAYSVLDDLESISRLEYSPAIIGGLPENIDIQKMIVTKTGDLYMLNGTEGNVLRATFTGQGFELDTDFICGPIPAPIIVGPLVDIDALPIGYTNGAAIQAMDSSGNILQCIPGGQPPLAFQLGPPDSYWGDPGGLTMNGYDLYVLDPETNAVWIYWAGGEYRDRPELYFGQEIPPMADVNDLAVNGLDLFLLHEDGHLTKCQYVDPVLGETKCTEPAIFNDLRPGREEGPFMMGATFNQMQFAPQPDPSIYLLDAEKDAIYHFSLRLAFQQQYRPLQTLSETPASAFAVGVNRLAFLAYGSEVYYAIIP